MSSKEIRQPQKPEQEKASEQGLDIVKSGKIEKNETELAKETIDKINQEIESIPTAESGIEEIENSIIFKEPDVKAEIQPQLNSLKGELNGIDTEMKRLQEETINKINNEILEEVEEKVELDSGGYFYKKVSLLELKKHEEENRIRKEREARMNSILSSRSEETPEEYTYRVKMDLQEEYFDRNPDRKPFIIKELDFYDSNHVASLVFEDKKLEQKFLETLNNLSANQERQSKEKDQEVLDKLNFSIKATSREAPKDEKEEFEKQDFFIRTNQTRKFFSETESIGDDAYAYTYMMFGLPDSFMRRQEMKNYIHSLLDDKTIFLFGGGDSVKDLLASEEYKPKKVINFDPYLKQESVGKRKNIDYESRAISASDRKIEDLAAAGELPKADEIWATYSVPYYLDKSENIASLIQNIASVLNEGGAARISPLVVQETESGGETYETRKNTLIQSIKQLMESDQFNVSLFGKTLKIHKLQK